MKEERKTLDEELKQGKEKLAKAEEELAGCRARIAELESELKTRSRAELIAKIFDVESGSLEFARSAFNNVVAQVKLFNKDLEISTEGLDAMKEVWDGELVAPATEE
ncbi:hypothetical protein A2U01_0050091 [Trifolium medium]|uniref:Uncharacterized protein n=1 Tax=Trifolium medium TaxID=97028 RepID=A0A392QX77_9FABA|nr:hypothetical protein [Trifolium medium]